MFTITCYMQLPQLSPRYLSRSWRLARYLRGLQTANLASSKHIWDRNDHIIYTQANSGFCRNRDTPVYMCFLEAKNVSHRANHWTLASKQLDRNVPLHIVKLLIYWYREQEFMLRWGNSLSMTFRCSNGIRQGGQLSPLLYNVYRDDLNHHLQATVAGCHVAGTWVNSLSYADDIVLLAPTVSALQTLLEVCRAYAGPHDIVYITMKTVCTLVRPKQSQGRYSTRVRLGNEELSFVEEFRFL